MKMNTFFTRLREERKRLGFIQEEFARAGGVKKLAQVNYEQGDRFPDVEYLFGISAVGADLVYLLTGQRQNTTSVSVTTPVASVSKFENMDVIMTLCSRDELALLHNYRCASKNGKEVTMDASILAEKDVSAAAA